MTTVLKLVDYLMDIGFTKKDTLHVVGGGITQDISSMCAALFKRGIDWIFTPTTLLSMCDSCIGSKMGINHNDSKNQLGTFYPPKQVIIDTTFLKTLSEEDIHSGTGEILKLYALDDLPWNIDNLEEALKKCLEIKKKVIEEDELEKTIRPCLNYGHTFGHVFESMSNFKIPHGVAVLIGMYVIDRYFKKDILRYEPYMHIIKKYSAFIVLDETLVLKHLKADKKVMSDQITLINCREFVKVKLDDILVKDVLSIVSNELVS
jgi:3-dehydroquinate synthase